MVRQEEIEACRLIKKTVIVGIFVFAAIAVAVMPSPGNLLYRAGESESTFASQSMEASVGTVAQSEAVNQTMIQPLIQPTPQPVAEPVAQPEPQPVAQLVTTIVSVIPDRVVLFVDQTFSVEVWIDNVTDMAGWEIRLLWNKEIVKCVKAQVNTPPEWGGVAFDWFNKTASDVDQNAVYNAWLFGSGIENDYNGTCGQYFQAETYGPRGGRNHNTFSGSMAVVTLTFQALQAGSTSLGLWKVGFNRVGTGVRDYEGMKIGDGEAMPIAHITCNGLVEVQAQ